MNRTLPDARWLKAGELAHLLAVLDHAGEEARVVGGAVRNALFGETPSEIDIATTAVPDTVIERARATGFKAVPTGIDHGTVTIIVEGAAIEVTTLRSDIETFGRKAKVAFGRDWKADAERRDFTMNALSVNRAGEIFDYVGGLADIDARRVRFIGDPARRIAEDYLRILRFFRFHATYGRGVPDPAGLAACIAERDGLAHLSRERIRMETLKLLRAAHATPTLAVMTEAGLLEAVLGGVPLLASFENTCKVETAAGVDGDPVRRLGALAVSVVEDAERLWQRLRLTNSEHARLGSIAQWWPRVAPTQDAAAARELIYRLGPDRYVDLVLVAWARSPAGAADTEWRNLATLPARWTYTEIPAQGQGFHPGAASRKGPRPRRRARERRGGLDRGRLPDRQGCARRARRRGLRDRLDRTVTSMLLAAFAGLTAVQLLLIAAMGVLTSLIGGVAGYGTGALMPLVLVPIVGAEPIVPIIAISALITNTSRATAFRKQIDWRRALIVLGAATPTCVLGAYGYTTLTGTGVMILIGTMLALSVPLRRTLKSRGYHFNDTRLAVASVAWGVLVGGTSGAGIILLSMLMAAGLESSAVIATDAVISVALGFVKIGVFGLAGVITGQVVAVALLIGLVAFPGAFLARALVARLPIHIHAAILDGVVVMGGLVMIIGALRR